MGLDNDLAAFGGPQIPLTPDEQRRSSRQRVLLSGRMVYGQENLTLDCAIRDVSESGARVRVTSPVALPSRVWLIEVRSGLAYDCELAWRRVPEFGLKILARHDLRKNTEPELMVLKRVWVESAAR